MALAYKCDRCGQIFNIRDREGGEIILGKVSMWGTADVEYKGLLTGTTKTIKNTAQTIDLCDDCLESLGEWFNGHQEETP